MTRRAGSCMVKLLPGLSPRRCAGLDRGFPFNDPAVIFSQDPETGEGSQMNPVPANQPIPEAARSRPRGPSPDKTARTREQIICAALEEFLAAGYAAATMAGIAARAGLAKGTPYRYFATKEELFVGVVQDVVRGPLSVAMATARLPGEGAAAYLRRSLMPALREIETRGRADVARLVLSEGRRIPEIVRIYHDDIYLPFLAYLRRAIELGIENGEITNPALADCPQILAAPIWMEMIHNGILAPRAPIDSAELMEMQIALVFSGETAGARISPEGTAPQAPSR